MECFGDINLFVCGSILDCVELDGGWAGWRVRCQLPASTQLRLAGGTPWIVGRLAKDRPEAEKIGYGGCREKTFRQDDMIGFRQLGALALKVFTK